MTRSTSLPSAPNSKLPLSNSTISTGNGADYLTVEGDITGSTISMGRGDDTVDLFGSGESLIYAGGGDDSVTGGDGNDTIYGDKGHDTLSGNAGNDTIYGGNGDDLIDGGTGIDVLYGGCGSDTFILNCGDGYSTIADFEVGSDALTFADTTNSPHGVQGQRQPLLQRHRLPRCCSRSQAH